VPFHFSPENNKIPKKFLTAIALYAKGKRTKYMERDADDHG
jgi:hypothetical protein